MRSSSCFTASQAKQIKHILNAHGANGKRDSSMKSDSDIAKMEYAISKYDSIVLAGTTNSYFEYRDGKDYLQGKADAGVPTLPKQKTAWRVT